MVSLLRAVALVATSLVACSSPVFAEVPSGPGDWPQWRGPNRNNLSTEKGYARSWPAEGPPVVWQVDTVGVGYSSLAIKDGLIVTQGDVDGVEKIICLKVTDGSTVWAVQPEPLAAALTTKIESETKRLDKNADGTIDEAEALAGIGPDFNNFDAAEEDVDATKLAAERVAKLVKLLDADGDGRVSFAETGGRFRTAFTRIDQADAKADAAALAKQRAADVLKGDKNGDGKLSKSEAGGSPLQDVFNRVDQKEPGKDKGDEQLTPEEIETYFTKSEAGRDGVLTVEELVADYTRTYPGKDGVLTAAELQGHYGGYRNSYGDGPRGTPTIDGKLVYAEGGNGDLTCLELATGKTLWHKNLATDFGGGRPGFGYSESPLVEGELLIVTPGGSKGTLAALNKYTGEEVWRSSAVEGAHYASPQVAVIAGVKQIVQFASKNVFGVRHSDGKLLWTYSKANSVTVVSVATPIIRGDYVYASSGNGTGGGLVHITSEDGKQTATEVYFDKTLANHHGGVLLLGDHIYGFGTGLVCQNFLTGENAWKARSVGKGSLTYADGLLFLLGEKHEVALADAASDEYRETGRFKIDAFTRPSWAHPVVAGGKLYIRNLHRLTAYDVRAR